MIFCQNIRDLEKHIASFGQDTIAFVPTMGALHDGHLTLIKHAKKLAKRVVVSIFVNPNQFTNPEDFQKYPRNIEQDIQALKFSGIDILFSPSTEEIYSTSWHPESLLKKEAIALPSLFFEGEGKSRPGHFEGVYQILYRLFSLIKPSIVVFGQKDFQQTLLVKHLIKIAFRKIQLEVVPTVREESGLALSSRNERLSLESRKKAKVLYQSLQAIKSAFMNGETSAKALITKAELVLKQEPLIQKINTLEIRNATTFESKKTVESDDIVLISVVFDGIHLIDNIILKKNK